MNHSNVERHSYNQGDFRRNNSERSDRSDFKKNQANSYLSSKNKTNTINSGAKAKIKQMLGRDHSNLNMSSEHHKMDSFSSNKRKTTGQKIYEGVLEYNPKKMHKKSSSLKADVMNKYFIKGGRSGADGHNEILNRSADDGHHGSGRHVSSSQQDRRNLSSGDQENFNNFAQGPHPSGGSGGVKVNSFLGSKNPPGMNMLNNCEPRKNLNEKIMNKYKKTSLLGGSKVNQSGTNNFNDLSMSKSEYNKPLYAEGNNASYNGGTGVYEKFIANTKKKNLVGSSSITQKDNNFIPGVSKIERGSSGYGASSNEPANNSGSSYKNSGLYQSSYSKNKAPLGSHHRKTESLNYKYTSSKKPSDESGSTNTGYSNPAMAGSGKISQAKKLGYKGVMSGSNERKTQKSRSGTNSVSYSASRKTGGQANQRDIVERESPEKNISGKKKQAFDVIEEIKARDRELPHFEKSKVIIKDFGANTSTSQI